MKFFVTSLYFSIYNNKTIIFYSFLGKANINILKIVLAISNLSNLLLYTIITTYSFF